MPKISFTEEQRERLRKLDLLTEQIAEIESALPLNRSLLEQPAGMADVREELSVLSAALKRAHAAAEKVDKGKSPKLNEARWRLELADFDTTNACETLPTVLKALAAADIGIQRALADLPNKERRSVAADFRPVARIKKALLDGFIKAHKLPLPPCTLRVSSSEGSKFREIVGICYEAMGQKNADPERAIKQYIALCKRESERMKKLI